MNSKQPLFSTLARLARTGIVTSLGLCLAALLGGEFLSPAISAQSAPSARSQTKAAISQPYHVMRWMTEEGLPQNTVTALAQTRDGYLWLGTFGGLARFDGTRFTIFNSANTPALKSNRITALLEDRDGALWIGAETGELARYRNGEFAAWPSLGGTILSFYQERNGLIWGLRTSARPIRFAPERPEQAAVVSDAQGLAGERMYSICEDRAGHLWATTRQGVTIWRDGAFRSDHGIEGLPNRGLPRIAPHPDGGLWLVEEKGLGRILNNRFGLLVETADTMGIPPPPLLETWRGEIWFGYREDRIWRVTAEGNFSELKLREAPPNLMRVMLEDREGNLWLGTVGGGLVRLRPHRVTMLSSADGLMSDEVLAISEDTQGDVWVATKAGLSRLAGGQSTLAKITSWTEVELERQLGGLPTLYRDQAGQLWLGGNGRLGQISDGQLVAHEIQGLSGFVRAILTDRSNVMWLGVSGQGLARYSSGTVTRLYTPADGLVSGEITVLCEDRAGALWIGTQQGLSQFKDGRFSSYTTARELSNDHVRDLYEDQDGALWIGTYGGGLNRLKDGRIAQITTKQGLFDDIVSRLLVDDRDRFWLLGNRGIFYVSRQQLNDVAEGRSKTVTCGAYGVADGMLSSEGSGISQPAGWRLRDGRMWLPTIKGIAIVDPRAAVTPPPPVVIEQVRLNNEAVDFRQGVEVPPSHENLEIQFTGLNLGKPEQVRFRYRLAGLETDWVEAGTRRAAYYPHLPPGAYTFHVLAANPDGVWSETSASIGIVVRAPFYQRWWFGLLLTLGFGLLALAAYRTRIAQLERRHRAEQTLLRKLIDSQEYERKRIAAELHDSLGQSLVVIKNRARLGLQKNPDAEAMTDQLEVISTAASLALDEVKEISYNLRPYLLDKLGLTKTIESMLRKVFDSGDLALELELDSIDDLLPRESEILLYRVAQESVNNIVKHSRATRARILIKLSGDGRSLSLTFEDNGCGFDPAAQPASDKRSFGLTSIAERTRLLNGRHTIVSAIGKGTTVTIRIDFANGTHETTTTRADC